VGFWGSFGPAWGRLLAWNPTVTAHLPQLLEKAMNPASEKMLDPAMDRVHHTLVEAENSRQCAGRFVKAFKARIKAAWDPQAERVLKAVAPIIPKLLSKSKAVDKDLQTLLDLGSAHV
jgi:hypothetical protein